jgi:hypothetical protein
VTLKVTLQGADEAIAILRGFGPKLAKKHLGSAVQAGAVVLAKAVRAKAPGSIAKGVTTKKAKAKTQFQAVSRVLSYSPLSHFFESGFRVVMYKPYAKGIKRRFRRKFTAIVMRQGRRGARAVDARRISAAQGGTRGGWQTLKAVPPRPFFKPAVETATPQAQAAIIARLVKGIEQEASRRG